MYIILYMRELQYLHMSAHTLNCTADLGWTGIVENDNLKAHAFMHTIVIDTHTHNHQNSTKPPYFTLAAFISVVTLVEFLYSLNSTVQGFAAATSTD